MSEQVTISIPNSVSADPTKTFESMTLDSVDGRNNRNRSSGGHENVNDRGHNSRNNHGSGRRRSSRSPSPSRTRRNIDVGQAPLADRDFSISTFDVDPLLVTDIPRRTSQTELDEDSNDDDVFNHNAHEPNPGVDDGFFIGTRVGTDGEDGKTPVTGGNGADAQPPQERPFPYPHAYGPNIMIGPNGNPQTIPDINVYQQKKNLAQGMMDLALLSANANQMRYVLESYERHPYYWFSLISISISLILQVAVGVGLIWNSKYNVKNMEQICRADKINNFTIIGIFLITIVNVFVSAFGVADPKQ